MLRSTSISCVFALGFTLFGFGCVRAPKPQVAAPAPSASQPSAPNPPQSVQMCVPGTEFGLDAKYLVVKVPGQSDYVFTRLEYECSDLPGLYGRIKFKILKPVQRGSTEVCEGFRVQDADVPTVLVMHSKKNGPLPRIYTRVPLSDAAPFIFAQNPCGAEEVEDDVLTAALD